MTRRIGLLSAIFICTNTMLGGGLFINLKQLTLKAGALGFVIYAIASLILIPLILCVAELGRLHPVSGGLYTYSKVYLNSICGFLSCWGYFLAKTTSAALLIHVVVIFIKQALPILDNIPILLLDYCFIFFVIFLNIMGLHVGGCIQFITASFKLLPVLFAILGGFYLFDIKHFFSASITACQTISSIPIALFAMSGFEIITSIGGLIKPPSNNIKKAVIIAFCFATIVNMVFQATLFGIFGTSLGQTTVPMMALGVKMFPQFLFIGTLINTVFFASMGLSFLIFLTSNCWNFHSLAMHNHLPGKRWLTKVNRHNVPWISILIEGLIASFILTITTNIIALQNMSVLAHFVTFSLTALAATQAKILEKNEMKLPLWIPQIATVVCFGITVVCLVNIIRFGLSLSFISVFSFGCFLVLIKWFLGTRKPIQKLQ
jgi:amino acid transporter